MPSLSALLGVGAATLFSAASATKYSQADAFPGSSFFDNFNFVTYAGNEPTNGFVKYVDRQTAEQKQYIRYEGGDAIFGVDYASSLNSADGGDVGRESVRLEGKKDYNKGLFVLDVKHMPGGHMYSSLTMGKGEIDIIEGVNSNAGNTLVLHTDTQCKVDGKGQSGRQGNDDCAYDSAGAGGCGVADSTIKSYGTGFNNNGGGHYVTEWQAEGIKIWFIPRGQAPASLSTGEIDTVDLGQPTASFQGPQCDIEKRFMDMRFIFTNTFCGDWAGNVYAQSGCPMYPGLSGMASCKKYVAEHPAVFKDAFWRVSSFKTYNKRAIVSSSSVAPSSTPHGSSSSVPTTTSSVHVSTSSVHTSSSSVAATSSSVHASSSSIRTSSSSAVSSSSSVHATSSSVAHSSSVVSSSVGHSSVTPTSVASSSTHPSSTPAVSSSSVHGSSSSVVSSSSAHDVSSSIVHGTSSTVSVSASASGTSASSSVIARSSVSETPYPHSIPTSSSYPASSSVSSSSISISSGVSSIYPTASSSVVHPSVSSSAYPESSSFDCSESTPASSTPVAIYSAYPQNQAYSYASASSKASSKASEYPAVSSKVPIYGTGYDAYPTASSKTPDYDNGYKPYPTGSSASASSVKSTSAHNDYPGLPSFTPLYSVYPADNTKTTDSYKTKTAYETTYVDVCSTGYTTITTKVTAIQTPAPYPTTDAYYAPPGFQVTTKYCAQGCGSGPATVTVTVPYHPASSAPGVPTIPSGTPSKPAENTPYTPGQPGKPSTPEGIESKVSATTIVTLTKTPASGGQYPATQPGAASPSASSVKTPNSGSNKGYGGDKPVSHSAPAPVGGEKVYPTGSAPMEKPVQPTVQPSAGKPVYPTAIGGQGSNITISYGTAVNNKPTQTGYKTPEFTGAASGLRVGGVVAGMGAVFAALMM
ncbi:hypothetical protein E8E13_003559 [Curvularia kusanoi]|uniref:GH16 domain-containing protein n=1 Tax=Curvularia kusanoi TaxID=90978 RepID=A0A9P4T635_CURKU|nr:hypothetical protein E8E13_003559 [Curvularia kusanoi]